MFLNGYKVAPLSRPSLHPEIANIPVVDLNGLNNPTRRSAVIKDISTACGNNNVLVTPINLIDPFNFIPQSFVPLLVVKRYKLILENLN